MYTDFKVLDGVIPARDAQFEDLFEFVRAEREVIAAGAEVASYEHERIRMMLRNTVAANWGKFQPGDRSATGDRGGFRGAFEKDMEGIVKAVMKPLDASYQNLAHAQYNLSRFPLVFARWMAPIGRPERTRDAFRTDRGQAF